MLRLSLRKCVTGGILICFLAGILLGFRFITRNPEEAYRLAAGIGDKSKRGGNDDWKFQDENSFGNQSATQSKNLMLKKMLDFRAKMQQERVLKAKMRANLTAHNHFTPVPFDENGMNYNVHIFYYMWYGNPSYDGKYFHWNHRLLQNWREKIRRKTTRRHFPPLDIASNYYPELGPYSSSDSEVLSIHMQEIRDAKIGCIAVSWYPPGLADEEGQPPDRLMPKLFHSASKHNLKVILHMEPYFGRNHTTFRRDIIYIMNEYGDHPALYKKFYRGKWLPMFYIYDSYRISPKHWSEIFHTNKRYTLRDSKYDAIYIGLALEESHLLSLKNAGFDGFYTYFATDGFTHASSWNFWPEYAQFAKKHSMFFIPSVAPGYIDLQVRPWNGENKRERENGKYYENSFKAAFNELPEFLSITSFNEWHEGTQIEPAIPKTFDTYHYLDYEENGKDFYLKLTLQYVKKYRRLLHEAKISAQLAKERKNVVKNNLNKTYQSVMTPVRNLPKRLHKEP
ncbi:glycoprotein endo-alpha-1,2-mannosidase-like [Octopus vulgaris]|uniref:Glycoprotein endo-alpha-1,2-mannosidase-like n=1 Tax=Octopus vulgaris TaxID=6645 RepID=A0AA36BKN3_OCTVU|nr:glycoprotein endo-alpha-1,2-mannosidase-like [Octopus vulgaris]